MIIDGHAHACGDFLNVENIIKILDRNQVDKVVLVPGELNSAKTYNLPNIAGWFPERDVVSITNAMSRLLLQLTGAAKHIHEGNEYVYSFVQQAPDRVLQFYWVMLHRPDIVAEVEQRFQEWQFRGIKFHQCWESFSVRSEKFDRIVTWAAEQNLPIFLHMKTKQEVRALIDYIRTHPKPTFIIAHLFGLEEYIKADLRVDNLYFEISSPPLISIKRLTKAIACFGAQKIIFGSDTPYGKESLRINLQRVKSLSRSEEEKQGILGENLQKLLQLEAS